MVPRLAYVGQMSEGVLLIGYGSDKPYNHDALLSNADRLRASGLNTYIAFIGAEEPTIRSAMKLMAEDGVNDVVVIPFMMSSGEMTFSYIPRQMGLDDDRYKDYAVKGTIVHYVRPVGEYPGIVDIIEKHVNSVTDIDNNTGIMLITHGSQMKYNAQMAQRNADELTRRGYKNVFTAFLDHNEPSIGDCARFMMGIGVKKIIAVPLIISTGSHVNCNIPRHLGIPENTNSGTSIMFGNEMDVYITGAIGVDDDFSDLLRDIVADARSRDD